MIEYVPRQKPSRPIISRLLKVGVPIGIAAAIAFGAFLLGPDSNRKSDTGSKPAPVAAAPAASVAPELAKPELIEVKKKAVRPKDISRTSEYDEKDMTIKIGRTIRAETDEEQDWVLASTNIYSSEYVVESGHETGNSAIIARNSGTVDLKEIIYKGEKVLDSYFANDDVLVVLTNKTFYSIPIKETDGGLVAAESVIKIWYLDVSEFAPDLGDECARGDCEVLAGRIERDSDASWEKLTVAVVTINGIIQTAEFDTRAYVDGRFTNKNICELSLALKEPKNRWPEKQRLTGAIIGIIDHKTVAVAPTGKIGGNVHVGYKLTLEEILLEDGTMGRQIRVKAIDWSGKDTYVNNILGATIPAYLPWEHEIAIIARIEEQVPGKDGHARVREGVTLAFKVQVPAKVITPVQTQ